MISCQVSEYPKIGPHAPQTTMMRQAPTNVWGFPHCRAVHCAACENAWDTADRSTALLEVYEVQYRLPRTCQAN
jgi:hypothetical protein